MSAHGYAHGTRVEVAKTRTEIDALLAKHGATSVAILNDEEKSRAVIAFAMKGARFRIDLPMPTIEEIKLDPEKAPSGHFWKSTLERETYAQAALFQRRRERWRAVLLLLKSKLEIVRLGLYSLEHEFLADMVLPGGATVHGALAEALRKGLASGELAARMLGTGGEP